MQKGLTLFSTTITSMVSGGMDLIEKPYLNMRFHAPDVQRVPEEVLEEAPPVVPVRIIRALPVHNRLTVEYAIRAV